MSAPPDLWRARARALETARRRVRAGHSEGLHDLRVALRRTGATAAALGAKRIAERSKDLVRSLSAARQLEVDRQLLRRVAGLGLLSSQSAAALDARWEGLARKFARQAARVASSAELRRLARDVSRQRPRAPGRDLARLERARKEAEASIAPPPPDVTDRDLHRYRLGVKRARYVGEALAAAGAPGLDGAIAGEKALQEALGRWNDTRLFRERLLRMRREAGRQGAVGLAAELDRVVSVLEVTMSAAREGAVRLARGVAPRFPRRAGRTA